MALYRCIGKGGGVTPTDITPSNSSPVSLTAGEAYRPIAAGYAIADYDTVTPSDSSPAAVTDGDICKMGGSGYAIESAPTSVTPSNASPVALASGDIDRMSGAGYAIESYSNVTPSDASPVTLTSGDIVKLGGNGKAVANVRDITPSDSTPAAVSSGDIVKMGGNGYAIESAPTSITPSDSTPAAITSGGVYKATAGGYAIETSPTLVTPSNSSPVALTSGEVAKIGGNGYAITSYDNISYEPLVNTSYCLLQTNKVYKSGSSLAYKYLYREKRPKLYGSYPLVVEHGLLKNNNTYTFDNNSHVKDDYLIVGIMRLGGTTSKSSVYYIQGRLNSSETVLESVDVDITVLEVEMTKHSTYDYEEITLTAPNASYNTEYYVFRITNNNPND